MKKTIGLVATLFAALAALAVHAATYSQFQPGASRITFVSRQMGVPVEGSFSRFTAQLAFDPAKPEAGKARLDIDLASIDAGSKEANEEVVGKNWFNVKAHPTATFVATGVKPLGSGRYEVRGPLSIKGKTRDVAAVFTFRQEGANGVFEGSFPLKRTEFAIGEGPWADTGVVADEVQIRFKLLATAGK